MVLRTTFGTQNHRLAHQVFNYYFDPSIVEEIAHSNSAAHLLNLQRRSDLSADIPERSVALVQKKQLWLKISGRPMGAVHLRIHVPVDQEEILPAVIGEIDKGITPAHIALRAPGNSRSDRYVR